MPALNPPRTSPLDFLLPSMMPGLSTNPLTALRGCWRNACEALELRRPPVHAFAELSLGEMLMESQGLPNGWFSDQAQKAFQIHRLIISAAAYLQLAVNERERGIGCYRSRAQLCLESLLGADSPVGWAKESHLRDFDRSYHVLGLALLEDHQALLRTEGTSLTDRGQVDSRFQETARQLAARAPLSRLIKGVGALHSLLWPKTETERMYSKALATLASLSYDIKNIGHLLRESFQTDKRQWLPGAAPILVAATLSQLLSPEDRIVAVVLKIPNKSGNGLKGDVDLLLNVGRKSKSGLSQGLHAIEVKYQNAFKSLMDYNNRELKRALDQLTVSETQFRELGFTVRKGVALFDSVQAGKTIEIKKGALSNADLYHVHHRSSPSQLTFSEKVLKLVFARETSLQDVAKGLHEAEI